MRQLSHRGRLIGGLIAAGIMALPIPLLFWPEAATALARLGVVALTIVFVVGLAIPGIARYRRAIGKPMPLDHILSKLQ